MRLGAWYVQRFADGDEIYFLGLDYLKNGNMSGVLVGVDAMRPRAMPKAKKSSVPQTEHFRRLWTHVLDSDVPEKVREAKMYYLGQR